MQKLSEHQINKQCHAKGCQQHPLFVTAFQPVHKAGDQQQGRRVKPGEMYQPAKRGDQSHHHIHLPVGRRTQRDSFFRQAGTARTPVPAPAPSYPWENGTRRPSYSRPWPALQYTPQNCKISWKSSDYSPVRRSRSDTVIPLRLLIKEVRIRSSVLPIGFTFSGTWRTWHRRPPSSYRRRRR